MESKMNRLRRWYDLDISLGGGEMQREVGERDVFIDPGRDDPANVSYAFCPLWVGAFAGLPASFTHTRLSSMSGLTTRRTTSANRRRLPYTISGPQFNLDS